MLALKVEGSGNSSLGRSEDELIKDAGVLHRQAWGSQELPHNRNLGRQQHPPKARALLGRFGRKGRAVPRQECCHEYSSDFPGFQSLHRTKRTQGVASGSQAWNS